MVLFGGSPRLLSGLLAWYSLGEAADTSRVDSGPSGFTLSDPLGNVGQEAGVNGFAASFQRLSTQQWLTNPNLILNGAPYSVSVWFEITASTPGGTVWCQNVLNTSNNAPTVSVNASGQAIFSTAGGNDTTGTLVTGFHHGVFTLDAAGNTQVFVDGTLSTGSSGHTFSTPSGGQTYVGQSGQTGTGHRSYNGGIQNLGVWNFVLSQAEVTWLYGNGTAPGTFPFAGSP